MFRCVEYQDDMQQDWDKLAYAKGGVFHTTGFRRILLEAFGYSCGYHAVVDGGGRLSALLPLVIGRNLALKQVGVCLPFVNSLDICAADEAALSFAAAELPRLRQKLGLTYIELRLKEQELSGGRSLLSNYTFVLPLDGGEEQIMALSTASNRNHTRKVYKNKWFSAAVTTDNLPEFYNVYVSRMKQLGSPTPGRQFFELFFQYLPDHAKLLTIIDNANSSVVGGMLLLASQSDSTMYYSYGANLIEYNSKYLNNFMYWEAVKLSLAAGLSQLDLGRSPAGSGTFRYKQQWGARPEQLKYLIYSGTDAPTGPPERDSFNLFVELWKQIPAFITNPIGRKLIKYIMP